MHMYYMFYCEALYNSKFHVSDNKSFNSLKLEVVDCWRTGSPFVPDTISRVVRGSCWSKYWWNGGEQDDLVCLTTFLEYSGKAVEAGTGVLVANRITLCAWHNFWSSQGKLLKLLLVDWWRTGSHVLHVVLWTISYGGLTRPPVKGPPQSEKLKDGQAEQKLQPRNIEILRWTQSKGVFTLGLK